MNLRGPLAAFAVAALLLGGLSPTASASTTSPVEEISGVLVQYANGVAPIAPNGEPTGANLLRGQVDSEALGGGLYVLNFSSPVNKDQAKSWIKRMVLDPRIVWAEPDLATQPTSVGTTVFSSPVFTVARPASGPRSLAAKPAVSSTTPDKARIRLTWKAPTSRYGAEIVGYRILYSSNNGASYQTLISDTGSDSTRIFVSDGIRAGISYRFRVRAITNDGSSTNTVGANSNTASASVRTAPKPVYITSATRVGPGNVTYLAQSVSDRGGFAANQMRYRAVATAADIESVETSLCNATRCRFPELLAETTYTVEVFATNQLGSSSSNAAVAVSDLYFPLQWYLNGRNGISMPAAWKYSQGDGSKVVAVIDTGIKSHQQIDKSLTRNADGSIYGYDFVSDLASAADGDAEDSNPNDEGGDDSGGSSYHGTHVAGIIAAEHDFIGTAGVAPKVKVLPIRALGKDGGTIADLVKAVNWAAGVKIDGVPQNKYPVSVINLSLGAKELVPCSQGYGSVFDSIAARGVTIVVAAGNEGRPFLAFPGNCESVITVVATQSLGDRATYSNYGPRAAVSAPGGEFNIGSTEAPDSRGGIISTSIDAANVQSYRLSEGTSMATPVVSGVVALMYSMQPNITPAKVRAILQDSVRPFAPTSNCAIIGGCGSGIINAQLALARTSALK
jgi:subtilisin family serine protease